MAYVGIAAATGALLFDGDDLEELFFVVSGQCAIPGSMADGTSRRLIGGNFSRESGPGVSSSVKCSRFFRFRLATLRGFFRIANSPTREKRLSRLSKRLNTVVTYDTAGMQSPYGIAYPCRISKRGLAQCVFTCLFCNGPRA